MRCPKHGSNLHLDIGDHGLPVLTGCPWCRAEKAELKRFWENVDADPNHPWHDPDRLSTQPPPEGEGK